MHVLVYREGVQGLYLCFVVFVKEITHHFGLLEDFTIGDIPSLYRDFVLLKLTTLNMTL